VRVIARDGKHAALRCGKAAITDTWVDGDDNRNAARHCSIKQAFQKSVARPAETQVDHLGIFVERELQRLRQGKAAAKRRIGAPAELLPTGTQCHQFGFRRNSGDAQAIVGSGGDDSGDRGSVFFCDVLATVDEISRQGYSTA